jgi:hypothetical protein
MVERFNATLKDMLRTIGAEFGNRWVDALQACVFAYNTSIHDSTNHTPYYLIYGREAVTPGDALALAAASEDTSIPNNPSLDAYCKVMLDAIGLAHDYVRSLNDSRVAANQRARIKTARNPVFKVGHQVLVHIPHDMVKRNAKARDGKEPRFAGPYTVTRVINEAAYEVTKMPNGPKMSVNVSRMKPYRAPTRPDEYTQPYSLPSPELNPPMLQPAAEVDEEQKDEDMDAAPRDADAMEQKGDEVEPFDSEDVAQEQSPSGTVMTVRMNSTTMNNTKMMNNTTKRIKRMEPTKKTTYHTPIRSPSHLPLHPQHQLPTVIAILLPDSTRSRSVRQHHQLHRTLRLLRIYAIQAEQHRCTRTHTQHESVHHIRSTVGTQHNRSRSSRRRTTTSRSSSVLVDPTHTHSPTRLVRLAAVRATGGFSK